MYEQYDLPITEHNIPAPVKDVLRGGRYGDLVEFNRSGWGTPDGECDTEVWSMTFVRRDAFEVIFLNQTYRDGKKVNETISYWACWLDHGVKQEITPKGTKIEDVVIDCDKIRQMVYKMLDKKSLNMEVA